MKNTFKTLSQSLVLFSICLFGVEAHASYTLTKSSTVMAANRAAEAACENAHDDLMIDAVTLCIPASVTNYTLAPNPLITLSQDIPGSTLITAKCEIAAEFECEP